MQRLHYVGEPGRVRSLDDGALRVAISIVTPLLGEGVDHDLRTLATDACFSLLQHRSDGVRHAALDAILLHCGLDSLERLRFLPRALTDGPLLERLHRLVDRLWHEPVDLMTVSPSGFEHLARVWFEMRGFSSVSRIGGVRDGGVDLLARSPDGFDCVIQCKRWQTNRTISERVLGELADAARSKRARRAILWTTSRFGGDARRLRGSLPDGGAPVEIELIDGRAVIDGFDRGWGMGAVRIRGNGQGSLLTLPMDAGTVRFREVTERSDG